MKTSHITFIIIAFFLTIATYLKGTTFYSAALGNLNSTASWGVNTNGTGTPPSGSDFNDGSVDTFIVANRSTFTHIQIWQLSASKVVVVGDGISSINLSINGLNGTIENTFIQVSNNATLTIINLAGTNVSISTSTLVNLHNNSLVNYTAANSLVKPSTYGSLSINGTGTSSLTGLINVDNVLTISNSRLLSIGSQTINIRGTISTSTGSFVTTNSSVINIGVGGVQTGTIGTLRFSGAAPVVNQLNISFIASTAVVMLGNSITIQDNGSGNSFFNYDFGNIHLNDNSLTIDANSDANFPFNIGDGAIIGTSNSSLRFNGAIGGHFGGTSLFMDATNNFLKVLSLNSSATTLDIGNPINITDSLSVLDGDITTNGNVTLKATASLKGRVGRIGATGSITGNVTVETFIPGSVTGWANLGIKGVTGQTIGNWDGQIPMTCNGCTNPTTAISGGFGSITEWDEVAANYVTGSNTTALTPGKGFWVYVGSGLTTTSDFTLINTGGLVQGAGSIPVTRTSGSTPANDGSNLIANPYASPISWTKFRALGSNSSLVTNAIYVWNADLATGAGAVTSYVAGAVSPGGSSIGDDIPSGQGFYVEAITSGSLTYDESIKTAANTGSTPLLRSSALNAYGKIFRIKLKGTYDWDATTFRIHPEATDHYDTEWDAHKIFQSPGYVGYPGVYTHYTTISSKDPLNEYYSIQSIPALTENVSIPLVVRVSASGTYTISGADLEDVSDCVLLNDNLLHTTINLKESNYIFSIDDTTSAARFDLILCKPFGAAPVSVKELVYSNLITINQDQQGAFVQTDFEENTKATISAYNIVGQKIMEDVQVEGKVNNTRLNLNTHNQVVLIRVVTDKESITKKILVH